ncbi:MAG TPA: sigma-54 dependent transcriptional regulator [Terracidiphilus sp.]|nr:sigma-54 dependent transcriptional regulator [Terracidiphilus sp.]
MRARTALVASADGSFRQRLSAILTGLRWRVREAKSGAEAWGEAMDALPQAIIVDSWLPDLDLGEFLREFRTAFPQVDVVTSSNVTTLESAPGPHRQEILYALRSVQETDTAAWNTAPVLDDIADLEPHRTALRAGGLLERPPAVEGGRISGNLNSQKDSGAKDGADRRLQPRPVSESARIPDLIGNSPCMLEISRRIRLVAPRTTPVLIEGPSGTGKEVVAESLHKLSARSRRPFVAINCAAIPEALLEAELFGHTRGAFTGAVHGRIGRIEAADGGTLFLDEIGEMPLGLQAKLLRFVECGELQRVGDNENAKVDVRIIAATHQPLAQHTQAGSFRADLYYRLAVFLVHTPALAEHIEDLPLLVDHFLERMGRERPVKRLDEAAMAKLMAHSWPGNVRELEHVLERAAILAGEEPVLKAADIDFGEPTIRGAEERQAN